MLKLTHNQTISGFMQEDDEYTQKGVFGIQLGVDESEDPYTSPF